MSKKLVAVERIQLMPRQSFNDLSVADIAAMLELPANHSALPALIGLEPGPKGIRKSIPVPSAIRTVIQDQLMQAGGGWEMWKPAHERACNIRDWVVADLKAGRELGIIVIQRGMRKAFDVRYLTIKQTEEINFRDPRFVAVTHINVHDLLTRVWANLEARIARMVAYANDPDAVKAAVAEAQHALVHNVGFEVPVKA